MARVTVEDCVVKIPNRFNLVLLAGQRAREIASGGELTGGRDNDKNPVVALREIAEGSIDLDNVRPALISSLQKDVETEEPGDDAMELLGADTNVAYVFSMKVHGAQKRASGDPYFSHPLEVAGILTHYKLDSSSIVTALLHDAVEDTLTTLDEIQRLFGPEIARLVDGVTKLSRIELQSDHTKQAEDFRKLLIAMSEDIRARLAFLRERGGDLTSRITDQLKRSLSEEGLEAWVSGREKNAYSIWRKMQRKNVGFEQLSDIMAFRVVVADVDDCYRALGIMHSRYPVVPGRFKDYISIPKPNDYRSLHTGVFGPERQRIEVQIRTPEMHDIAEFGVAAHWT